MRRVNAFLSYSHKDRDWLERVSMHLAVLERKALIHLWSDTRISIGASWKSDIENALGASKVAILLVSPAFLASEFIWQEEMPRIMEHRKAGMEVLPLIVRPCAWLIEEDLAQLQVHPSDARPLTTASDWQADLDMASFVYLLAAKLGKTSDTLAAKELDLLSSRYLPSKLDEVEDVNEERMLRNERAAPEVATLSLQPLLGKLPVSWKCLYKSDAQRSDLRLTITIASWDNSSFSGTINYPDRGAVTYIEGHVLGKQELEQDLVLLQFTPAKTLEGQVALKFKEIAYKKEGNMSVDFDGEYRVIASETLISGAWISAGRIVGILVLDLGKGKSRNSSLNLASATREELR